MIMRPLLRTTPTSAFGDSADIRSKWEQAMSITNLRDLLCRHKGYILEAMKYRMSQLPDPFYREFLLGSEEGSLRMPELIDMLINGAEGQADTFFEDQERVGYLRRHSRH